MRQRSTFHMAMGQLHEDNRGNGVAFGWLAITTLNDPSLGTIQDAKTYYELCLKATMRRDELYGKRTKEELPPVLDILHRNFQQHPEAVNFQRDLHHIIQGMGGTSVEEKGGLETKFSCVTCGALQGSNGGIMKCSSRCRLVSYCSKDCQRADWKNHKGFCKLVKNKAKATAVPIPIPIPEASRRNEYTSKPPR